MASRIIRDNAGRKIGTTQTTWNRDAGFVWAVILLGILVLLPAIIVNGLTHSAWLAWTAQAAWFGICAVLIHRRRKHVAAWSRSRP